MRWLASLLRRLVGQRPPWPLYDFPRRGETLDHAACREWWLPCDCDHCRKERARA